MLLSYIQQAATSYRTRLSMKLTHTITESISFLVQDHLYTGYWQ